MPESKKKSVKVQIPIQQGENLVRFPNKCVYCGKPPTRAYKLTVQARQEVGKVRKIFASKAYLRTLAGVKTLTSTSHMAVPYCKEHFMATSVDKWIIRPIGLLAWFAGMGITWNLFLDTFLAEGYWAYLLFVLALFGGWALSGITMLAAQKVIGLAFPEINEIDANVFKGDRGPRGGLSIFYKDLLGITANPKSISLLEVYLENPEIANNVLKLNTGTPDEVAIIDVWPDSISMPAHSVEVFGQTRKTNSLATTSLILGVAAVPLSICLGIGAVFGVAALITGGVARHQIRESNGTQGGENRVIWGMILGGIGVLLGIALVIIIMVSQIKA